MKKILGGERTGIDVRCHNCNVLYEHDRGKFPNHIKLIEHISKCPEDKLNAIIADFLRRSERSSLPVLSRISAKHC